MFDVGFPELVLIFVIALLVLGPQRLPKVAAEIGKWVGRARRTAMQLRRQLEREIELNEVIMPPKPPPRPSAEEPPATNEQSGSDEPLGTEAGTDGAGAADAKSEAPAEETPAGVDKSPQE